MPVGEAIARCGDDEAELFEAIEVFGNGVEFFLGGAAFELGGDLFGSPVAGGSAEQVADGGELGFGLGGPLLLLASCTKPNSNLLCSRQIVFS